MYNNCTYGKAVVRCHGEPHGRTGVLTSPLNRYNGNGTVTVCRHVPDTGWTVLGAGGTARGNQGQTQGNDRLERVSSEAACGGADDAGGGGELKKRWLLLGWNSAVSQDSMARLKFKQILAVNWSVLISLDCG